MDKFTRTPHGMPGLRGLDHAGFTVPDLQQAEDFFCEVLGCHPSYALGSLQRDDAWMAENLNVHPRAVLHGVRFLRCPNGASIELFAYQAPDQQPQPRNTDIGGHHLAFYVDDCHAATAYLRARGVRVLGEPKASQLGPSVGQTWVYFLTPWGMQCELVSYPQGKACDLQCGRAHPFGN
ncbi:VOC family protein [Rhodoferax lacus]|uniref:VOC family protein n=1 Tax=Rhodoferax lacus TaxID=2184758 RepID=UPI0018F6927B|nr:VOC family protein [Rhodoferax lacus]